MTFDEIVAEACEEFNLTSSDQILRVGRLTNIVYKAVLSSAGMQMSTRVSGQAEQATIGSRQFTASDMWKVTRVYYVDSSDNVRRIEEVHYEVVRDQIDEITGDDPTMWGAHSHTSDSVLVLLDKIAETTYTLGVDGRSAPGDLDDDDEPAFPSGFHDIIFDGVCERLGRKPGTRWQAEKAERNKKERIAELRHWNISSLMADTRVGSAKRSKPWQR